MARQLRSSTQNKRPRPETEDSETDDQTGTEAPAVAQAGTAVTAASTLAIDRTNIAEISSLGVESRTDLFARFPEGARLAVYAEFTEFAGASAAPTTAAVQVLPPFALPLSHNGPDPTATSRALAEATEAK